MRTWVWAHNVVVQLYNGVTSPRVLAICILWAIGWSRAQISWLKAIRAKVDATKIDMTIALWEEDYWERRQVWWGYDWKKDHEDNTSRAIKLWMIDIDDEIKSVYKQVNFGDRSRRSKE